MATLSEAAEQAVRVCLGLKESETALIICDRKHLDVGQALNEAASYARTSLLILEDLGPRPIKEIPQQLLDGVDRSDVVFFVVDTVPGELATLRKPLGLYAKTRCRYAHMPDADEQVLIKGIGVDNLKVQEFTEKIFQAVSGAEKVEVSSGLGTRLSFTLDPQRQWIVFGSVLRENGWTNLPGAEVAVCPLDVQGTAVIDGVVGDFFVKYGCVRETPVTLTLEKSRVVHVECKNVSLESELRAYLRTDEASNRIGELAFGTNQFLKGFSGKMIIDEKFPTVHFAAGHPYVAEGEALPYDSKTHVDFVMKSVTANVDGKTILKDGSYNI